jgi:uncharacterized protein
MERKKLEQFNEWWIKGDVDKDLTLEYKRELYYELEKALASKFIFAIVGLRRTGKTTIMYQLIQHLLDKDVNEENILFFSFDESVKDLDEVIETYREIHNVDFRKEKFFMFFDEIQKCPDWENQVKKYYDLYPKLKIILSGSESLFIRKKNKETLAGRVFEFMLEGLNFREYLGLKKIKKENFKYESVIQPLLLKYVRSGSFPETVSELSEKDFREYIRSLVVDKIVYRDIPVLYNIEDPNFLIVLLELISKNPGMYIDYQSLAKQYNKDRRIVKKYLEYLEQSFLIKILGNYRKGSAGLRKLKRAYPSNNAFIKLFNFSIDETFFGKMVENLCINQLNAKYFWKNGHEIDVVDGDIPVEIKYKSDIGKNNLKGIREFMKKFNKKNAVVITKNIEKISKIKEGKIKFIPLWKWLLQNNKKS